MHRLPCTQQADLRGCLSSGTARWGPRQTSRVHHLFNPWLSNGYWQLPVHKEDHAKTVFCPGLGLFQSRRMPFTSQDHQLQRLMDRICCDLPFATTYLDDLLIHAQTLQEHSEHLHILFECFSQAGSTLWGEKCTIGSTKVKYIGHLFSAKGTEPLSQTTTKYLLFVIGTHLRMLVS